MLGHCILLLQEQQLCSLHCHVTTTVIINWWKAAGSVHADEIVCYQVWNNFQKSWRRREKSKSKEDSPTDNASPKSAIELKNIAHSRTKSDITPTATGSNNRISKPFKSLNRSKSIASARDKWKISSSYGLLPFLTKDNSKNSFQLLRQGPTIFSCSISESRVAFLSSLVCLPPRYHFTSHTTI